MRKDILLVKHCYDINWAKDLNNILSEIFYDPINFKELSYLPGRSQQAKYEAYLLKKMRQEKINKVFFVNYIDDFSNNFIKSGFAKEIYGIVHSSNNQLQDVGGDYRLTHYEKGILPIADKLFVNSEYLNQFLEVKGINLGLPISNTFAKPKINSDQIIFNHRLASEKGVSNLFDIKDKYKDRITICSPKGSTVYAKKLKEQYNNFYFRISHKQYKEILQNCGFEISFATHETFGYGVHDAIENGLCPLVLETPMTCYKETIIDELRFKDLDDLYNKIDNLTQNKEERKRLILKQQEKSKIYKKDNYIKNLLENLQ